MFLIPDQAVLTQRLRLHGHGLQPLREAPLPECIGRYDLRGQLRYESQICDPIR